jgi:hydroxypyruvate isomerase
MNRRKFARTMVGAALGGAALPAVPALASGDAGVPFKLSVMLWTVYKQLPFDQRLEKVAEAGYHAVELVNEFKDWSADDFKRVNATKRALGITFDATAGVWKGIADPGGREAFLADLKTFFPVADKL